MMEELVPALQQLVSETLASMADSAYGGDWEASFANYQQRLGPALRRYHISDDTAIDVMLRARFQYETALLHIVTHMLRCGLRDRAADEPEVWPVDEPGRSFAQYRLPEATERAIADLVVNLTDQNLSVMLAQASGELLNQAGRRYLGEYHTPLPLVKHLIQLADCGPANLLGQKQVVDPACGSGIILVVLANASIQHGLAEGIPVAHILSALSNNLHGFDIQPFAIALSRSLLLYVCYSSLGCRGEGIPLAFPNVRLLDPLAEADHFWTADGGFDYVIGNPPYMRVRQQQLDYLPKYRMVINGHANLYQLFLWWAVQAARPGGMVSFLVPQSMLAGSYFEKLRERLSQRSDLLEVTRMVDRKGVVGDADLQMMAVSLQVKGECLRHPDVYVRVTRNGNDVEQTQRTAIPYRRVMRRIGSTYIWVVSDRRQDYSIAERLERACVRLEDLADRLSCGNGGYVWNQHKQLLLSEPDGESLPLVSAASVQPYRVTFPYVGSHPTWQRQFSYPDDSLEGIVHSGTAVLVQRTTPRKVGRRLIAGLLADDFCTAYPRYFLENHVNYVQARVLSESIQVGLTGWLNSDLINFVFQLRNGTTLVSVSEIGLLPVNVELLEGLVPHVEAILEAPPAERLKGIQQVNRVILDWVGLGPKHRRRILDVLSRKERGELL